MINWRWYLFWVKDFIQGGKVRKAYKEFEVSNENVMEDKLQNLIKEAKENTKFYSKIDGNNIKDFPIISKVTINENYDDFKSKKYLDKKLHVMSTSGSTGIPFTILQNSEKRNRVLAELLYYNVDCGYQFGRRQVFFRIWTEKNKKSKFQSFIQNLVAKDISELDDNALRNIAEELKKDKKIDNILSYASTLERLSNYMIGNNYNPKDFSIKSIISSSEVLQDETRNNLKRVFDCNIVSRYSNQEMGVLAQECIDYKEMHLNTTNYYIEFLKLDSDEEAAEGEIARVVVTDLYNYAMPMIRYDTGDLAIYSNTSKCGKAGRVITEIFGRKVDLVYNTNGQALSPHVITNNMWGIEGVKQFKFQQTASKEYKIILNAEKNSNIENKLVDKFLGLLGADAKIEITYVDEIPILASGKRKYIENLITNK